MLPFFAVKQFSDAWESKAKEIASREFQSGADSFRELGDATVAINNTIRAVCVGIGVSPDVVGWPGLVGEFPSSIHEITAVHEWLEKNGLVVRTTTAPAPGDSRGVSVLLV